MTKREYIDRLAELDLDISVIERALRGADAEARTCTPMDPTNLAGLLRWGRTNRILREQLYPRGWGYDNPKNLPRTIHPTGEFAIVATSGDELTGIPQATPSNKNEKGVATVEAVKENEQLTLEFDLTFERTTRPLRPHATIWMLLYYVNGNHIHAELSMPKSVDGRGKVNSWLDRIILPVFSVGGEDSSPVTNTDRNGIDTFDVPVSRRQ